MKRRRYVHELREQAAVCERNYHRLWRLLPGFPDGEKMACRIHSESEMDTEVTFQVAERFRYTATVDVTLEQNHMPPRLARHHFRVRVYLDANTSEVVSLDHTGSLKGVYHYPNPNMYQADEKAQLNRWLSEWLQLLFEQGVTQERILFT